MTQMLFSGVDVIQWCNCMRKMFSLNVLNCIIVVSADFVILN